MEWWQIMILIFCVGIFLVDIVNSICRMKIKMTMIRAGILNEGERSAPNVLREKIMEDAETL